MLSIQNINILSSKNKKLQRKQAASQNKSFNSHTAAKNFTSIFSSNINFTGYYKAKSPETFQKTLDENYFQLPQVKFKDGSNYQLRPDNIQLECARRLYDGDSVVLCAPTGTGKTADAHYSITLNLKKGKKTIYTTPLKALANDKFREFKKIYGEENVGLLTGDIKLNAGAPVVIMTTEIYNNQASGLFKNPRNVGSVIFDEAHYLGDKERGNVWEYSILKTPLDKIQILCPSATIGNSDELSNWIQSLNRQRKVSKIELPPQERFVPLVTYLYRPAKTKTGPQNGEFTPVSDGKISIKSFYAEDLTERQKRALEIVFKTQNGIEEYYEMTPEEYQTTAQQLITLTGGGPEGFSTADFKERLSYFYPELEPVQKEEMAQLLLDHSTKEIKRIHSRTVEDNYPQLVQDLREENMLPALIFKLSRRNCEEVAKSLSDAGVDLTTDEEKAQIEKIIEEYLANGVYFGTNFNKNMLISGFAYHHAGELPQYRKLVEELFSKKLLKTVIATSTLSAGINMPARTVVISDTAYKKFNPATQETEYTELSASEFHQMSGRAGRRGIDSLGYVVLYNLKTPNHGFKKIKPKNTENTDKKRSKRQQEEEKRPDELQIAYNLMESPAESLRSHFRPDWQMLAQYYGENSNPDGLRKLIGQSFKIFISKNPQKDERAMFNRFENYKTVLLKQGFLVKDNHDEISITPKGKILEMCRGANPLLLSSLIYNKKLKGLNPEQLCLILGAVAGSSEQQNGSMLPNLLDEKFSDAMGREPNFEKHKQAFNDARKLIFDTEKKIIRNVLESRIPQEETFYSDAFSGYAAYLWAYMNSENPDSIENFKKITTKTSPPLKQNSEFKEVSKEFARKSAEGNVYKIISQLASILKQVDKICDFALSNPELYPNSDYYTELKENAQLAMVLVKQNPIYDETAV